MTMQTVSDWIFNFLSDTASRIDYSIDHMNLTQWGIFAVVSLSIGVMAMRSRMPS